MRGVGGRVVGEGVRRGNEETEFRLVSLLRRIFLWGISFKGIGRVEIKE